jgi:hypothetical protein
MSNKLAAIATRYGTAGLFMITKFFKGYSNNTQVMAGKTLPANNPAIQLFNLNMGSKIQVSLRLFIFPLNLNY